MDRGRFTNTQMVWKPDENSGQILRKFQKIIEEKYKVQFKDFWDFHKWSVGNLTPFWSELWDFSGIIASKKFDKVIDEKDSSISPEWFPGAKLNFAENLLKYRDDRVALILAGEDREPQKVTFREMFEEVKLYAAAFRKLGLKKGDVVVSYISNRKEAIIAMEATTSIGAVWSGALPLLGPEAVLNRLQQVSPKFLLTIDRFKHQGREIEMLDKVKIIVEGLPTLEKTIIVGSNEGSKSKDISSIKNSCFLEDFLKMVISEDNTVPSLTFEQVSISHPVFISYTSGTTGIPKALIHGSGAILSTFRDFSMHVESGPENIWFTVSPPGWGTWAVFAILHFLGEALFLFEGVPYFLSPTYFWDIVDEFKISHIFLPSSIMDELQNKEYIPSSKNHLKNLKVIFAGGTVVKSQSYDFVYEKVKKDVIFSTLFGSTEFMGCCLIMDSTLPVYKEELATFGLGVDIKALDETGNAVLGELGELVLMNPMPNLPVGLWGDTDDSLYRKTYFSKYPGKFTMGDYAIINPVTKGIKICCRSDETLKQRGCRFGSSEIYNVVDKFSEVQDSICVSQYNKKMDERAVLFLKMKEGYCFNEELVTAIRQAISKELTTRHVPDIILEVKDIPYNMNGKKLEITVKKIINHMLYSADTTRNPESLKFFLNVPELQGFQ